MKKIILIAVIGLLTVVNADNCFDATGKAFKDAQTMRKIANSLGWKIAKTTSITAGTFIKGKKTLYPQDNLEVCIEENSDKELVFKAQSSASDAGNAEWRPLLGKKKK